MQFIENDMDDLFRRAADNYSLSISGSDWEKVAAQAGSPSPTQSGQSISNGNLFSLLLLGMLLILPMMLFSPFPHHASSQNMISNASSFSSTGSSSVINSISKTTFSNDIAASATDDIAIIKPSHDETSTSTSPIRNPNTQRRVKKSIGKLSSQTASGEWAEVEMNLDSPVEMKRDSLGWIEKVSIAADTSEKPTQLKQKNWALQTEYNHKDTLATDTTLLTSIHPKNKQHKWYVGLIGGPQFCEVKGQGYSKTGFDIGLFAGYRLNKKLSIEGGFGYTSKKYFSDGKYFDKMKASSSMPVNMKILSLEGSSEAIELFARLKLDLFQFKQTHWFINSGISSFFLTKESNNYYASINGINQYVQVAYNKGSFAASWYFGAGVNLHLFQSTSISISPYVQLPLNGIGVGALPVSTSGLKIGITLPMRKK